MADLTAVFAVRAGRRHAIEDTQILADVVHEPTQTQGRGVDLTVAEALALTEPCRTDSGGGELEPAGAEPLSSTKRDPADDYGWWHLEERGSLFASNESLAADRTLTVQPRRELVERGGSHPRLTVSELPRVPVWVAGAGLRLTENARVSKLVVADALEARVAVPATQGSRVSGPYLDPMVSDDLGEATIVYDSHDDGPVERTVQNEHVAYFQEHWIVKTGEDDRGRDTIRRIPRERVYHVERTVEAFDAEISTLTDQVRSLTDDIRERLSVGGDGGARGGRSGRRGNDGPVEIDVADETRGTDDGGPGTATREAEP